MDSNGSLLANDKEKGTKDEWIRTLDDKEQTIDCCQKGEKNSHFMFFNKFNPSFRSECGVASTTTRHRTSVESTHLVNIGIT